MRTQKLIFRTTAALAVGGLLLGPGGISVAMAQSVPGPAPGQAAGDPPARVGRLARTVGTVSFHAADETQWVAATLNYPVTSGNAFWTEPTATADIEVGATRVTMDQSTEFDVDTLDDTTLAATLAQGAVFLDVMRPRAARLTVAHAARRGDDRPARALRSGGGRYRAPDHGDRAGWHGADHRRQSQRDRECRGKPRR